MYPLTPNPANNCGIRSKFFCKFKKVMVEYIPEKLIVQAILFSKGCDVNC